jgi:hypothetical protein
VERRYELKARIEKVARLTNVVSPLSNKERKNTFMSHVIGTGTNQLPDREKEEERSNHRHRHWHHGNSRHKRARGSSSYGLVIVRDLRQKVELHKMEDKVNVIKSATMNGLQAIEKQFNLNEKGLKRRRT